MTFQITDDDSDICAKAISQMTPEQFYLFMKLCNAINENAKAIFDATNKIAELQEIKGLIDLR